VTYARDRGGPRLMTLTPRAFSTRAPADL